MLYEMFVCSRLIEEDSDYILDVTYEGVIDYGFDMFEDEETEISTYWNLIAE